MCTTSTLNNCRVAIQRDYTPILIKVNPPAAYYGSEISLYMNTKYSPLTKVNGDEFLTQAKIGDSLLDYHSYYDETTAFGSNTNYHIRALVGDVIPAQDNEPLI